MIIMQWQTEDQETGAQHLITTPTMNTIRLQQDPYLLNTYVSARRLANREHTIYRSTLTSSTSSPLSRLNFFSETEHMSRSVLELQPRISHTVKKMAISLNKELHPCLRQRKGMQKSIFY